MTSNTFSYNNEESSSILAQSTFSSDFLKIPPRETRGRDLERALRHQVNTELHCATLSEYLRVKRIPRGLRVPLRPTLFSDCSDYCLKFEQILNKCSFDLITLTLEHLHKAIEKNVANIRSIETQLSATGTTEELKTLRTQIQERVDLHKRDTENRKRSKFSRDTIDYETNQVYRWHDNSTSRRQSSRNQRSTTDYSTSGSDQERNPLPSTSAPFLGQRRRFPKRRQDGAPPRRDIPDQMRITRSKSRLY
ncbi:uncharacterized protein LOC143783267 [Ranitomeya variabilis]|uniref:uncharacterized protein LOC143783267 n=1 Tax=Ranitomeya variabilis TaxID=490064 RepID=UPI004057974C